MSIDLTRAQISSMGQHDPLDGYLTTLQLRATAAALPPPMIGPDLEDETREFTLMIEDADWSTADPLGIGGLLSDAYHLQQLRLHGVAFDESLIDELLRAALNGLHYYARSGELHFPAQHRLAFRELGLAVGLRAVQRMQSSTQHEQLHGFKHYLQLSESIETFWRDPAHQQSSTWTEHQDINEVMLATSLAPDGYLELYT